MTAPRPSDQADNPTPAEAGVLFTRTHDGLLVAKVRDNAFAMMPATNGRYYLASAWLLSRPMEEWSRGDFYGHGGELAGEAAFRARVHENAEHQRQLAALGRREIRSGANTPWGASQCATVYADGVVSHSTTGHGGFHLAAAHNAKVHPALRAHGGWYEEDCAWAAVAQALPELFTEYERRCADQTIRDWHPDRMGDDLQSPASAGEYHEKDRRAFERRSRLRLDRDLGHPFLSPTWVTECVATLGGDRRAAEQRRPSCTVRRISDRPIWLRDQ